MEWTEQSGAHKFIRDVFVVFANIVFAMPALTALLLVGLAGYGYWTTGIWRTPSMLELIRQTNPHILNTWSGLIPVADQIPVWLASLTLSLLIFVWASQKSKR